jgi:hypothetical protein
MEQSSFLISGDSWGCGEWGWDGDLTYYDPESDWKRYYNSLKGADWPKCPPFNKHHLLPEKILIELKSFGFRDVHSINDAIGNHTLVHTGIQQYFEDMGCRIKNISRGGASNNYAIKALSSIDLSNFTTVIWIQTDPIRDLQPYVNLQSEFTTFEQLLEKQKSFLTKTYSDLNSMGKKIICLGGCSKLDLELIKEFENLVPLIPSIIEFLCPEFQHPTTWISDWDKDVDRLKFSLNDLDKLLCNKKIQDSLFEDRFRELFWPDGMHPNRHAWKIVFDYLIIQKEICVDTQG